MLADSPASNVLSFSWCFCKDSLRTVALASLVYTRLALIRRWPLSRHACTRRLTALGSVSGCPVTDLRLSGGVPLSSAVASAVASLVPGMSNLCLYFQEPENDLPQGDRDGEQASKYYFGAIQLLTLCGPRLRKLGLWGGVQHWPGMTFQALSLCTALRELELEAGSGEFDASQGKGAYLGEPY